MTGTAEDFFNILGIVQWGKSDMHAHVQGNTKIMCRRVKGYGAKGADN